MKKLLVIAAVAMAALTTPAMAQDFAGPRIEVAVGADDVKNGVDTTDLVYGAALGYDIQHGKFVFGVDASAANIFDDADLGVGARAGYVVSENVLAYTRVGYTNLDLGRRSVDGATIGGGFEVNVSDSLFVKAEYRYTDFDDNLGRHGGLVGLGVRF
jgi:outer membrane immunogenic protein